ENRISNRSSRHCITVLESAETWCPLTRELGRCRCVLRPIPFGYKAGPRRAARGPQIIGPYKCAVGARAQTSLMSRKTKEDIQMPSRTKLPMPGALVLMAAIIAAPLVFGAAYSVHAVRAASLYPYTLVDLGTLGGPQAGQGNAPSLSGPAVAVGTADTAMTDPHGMNEHGAFPGVP